MKKFSLLIFLFIHSLANAQYFDWNLFFNSSSEPHEGVGIQRLEAGPQGHFILTTTYSLWDEFYTTETIYDTDGNELNSYIQVEADGWIDFTRESHFDYDGNIMQIMQNDSGYTFTYFRQADTLLYYMPINGDVAADASGGFYLLYRSNTGIDSVQVYDVNGMWMNTVFFDYGSAAVDGQGNIYFHAASLISKYDKNGTLLYTYSGSNSYLVNKSGKLLVWENDTLKKYDSSSVVFQIPYQNVYPNKFRMDVNDNLYIWKDDILSKYEGDTLSWKCNIPADYLAGISVDDSSNIYYAGTYIFNHYDGDFFPTYINVPPNLYGLSNVWYNAPYADGHTLFRGKINHAAPDSFYAEVESVENNNLNLCTGTPFNVRFDYHQLPFDYYQDTLFVELSDSSGQFTSPYIIGKGSGVEVTCFIPDSVPSANGYLVRGRIGSPLYTTPPFNSTLKVITTPLAPIYIENTIDQIYTCLPYTIKTNPDTGLYMLWMRMPDPEPADTLWDITYLSEHDSDLYFTTIQDGYIRVMVTQTSTGCHRMSESIVCDLLNPFYPLDLSLPLPDSIRINELPVQIGQFGSNMQIEGPGIYNELITQTSRKVYFYPDSAKPGWNLLHVQVEHTGDPCIPFENYQYIYVDTNTVNIILNAIDSNPYLCPGDTLNISFQLLDSTVYDSTNYFVVEIGAFIFSDDNVYVQEISRGKNNNISCVLPAVFNGGFRVRIRSTQTDEFSNLNSDGEKYIISTNLIHLANAYDDSTLCFPLNDTIKFNSSFGLHEWFRNDTLIASSTGNNLSYVASQEGDYRLQVSSGCLYRSGVIHVDANSHKPTLAVQPVNYYLESCGGNPLLLTAQTDAGSTINWYVDDKVVALDIDSFYAVQRGIYTVKAVSGDICPVTVQLKKSITCIPDIFIYKPVNYLCEGDSTLIEIYTDADIVHWYHNGSFVGDARSNYFANDTGAYYGIAEDTLTGCTSMSESIYIKYKVPLESIMPPGVSNISTGNAFTLSYNNILNCSLQWNLFNQPIAGSIYDTLIASLPGSYSLTITDSTGCTAVTSKKVLKRKYRMNTIEPPKDRTGSNSDVNPYFNIYPNPNNGSFTIEGINSSSEVLYGRITDVAGRVTYEFKRENIGNLYKEEFNLEMLSPGYYNLQLNNGISQTNTTLIIN
ncbi:MAG: T9SS type A sorting domain-containing protein [Bacteroidota bacterium]